MGLRSNFENHIADTGIYWYPLFNVMVRFTDPLPCLTWGFDIAHDMKRDLEPYLCEEKPPWLPASRWYW